MGETVFIILFLINSDLLLNLTACIIILFCVLVFGFVCLHIRAFCVFVLKARIKLSVLLQYYYCLVLLQLLLLLF
jgi:hypothetical protein